MSAPNAHDDRVQRFIEQLEQADPAAQARHYAEVFAQLMEFPGFVKYVRTHYLIGYFIDDETGALVVNVQEVQAAPSEAETSVANAFDRMKEK